MPIEFDGKDSWRIFRIMAEFVEGFEVMSRVGKAVSMFGSARTRPDEPHYKAAEETARLLAKNGFAVITGGGPGIMEAGNKGCFEAGGTSVGLNISLPHEQESNKYQNINLDFHYFYARKVMFTKYASAFICFPGGFGTFDETFEVLTLIQTLKVDPFPLVLYGSRYWSGLVEWMKQQLVPGFIDREDLDIFRLTDDPKEAVKFVKEGVKKPWWKPTNGDLARLVAPKKAEPQRAALESVEISEAGEGTRYGRRPRRAEHDHAVPSRKPSE